MSFPVRDWMGTLEKSQWACVRTEREGVGQRKEGPGWKVEGHSRWKPRGRGAWSGQRGCSQDEEGVVKLTHPDSRARAEVGLSGDSSV